MITIALMVALSQAPAADAPKQAPDEPGISVWLDQGEIAPFSGRLLAKDENERRGQKTANLEGQLAKIAIDYFLMPRYVVAIMISVTAAALAALAGITVAAAEHKL